MPQERQRIEGPFAWTGRDISHSKSWTRTLDAGDVALIDAALAAFGRSGYDWARASRATLPLEGMAPFFDSVRRELEDGTGFVRIRGLDVERYSLDQLRAIFLALGDHIGMPVSQSVYGERLMGLTDEGAASAQRGVLEAGEKGERFLASRARVFSTGELRYHTDRCDVVGLLCVRKAKRGGVSRIVSAVAIHNAMLARRPDLLDLLFGDYPRSRFGEEVKDASTYYMLPVFACEAGKFATHYSRTYVEAAQKNPDVPKLSPAQWEALDLLAEFADQLSLDMTLEPGDIQLLNNHVIYHARTPYEDFEEPDRKRLLFRLWLAMPNSRALPESFGVLFEDTAPGTIRGGIWPPDVRSKLPAVSAP